MNKDNKTSRKLPLDEDLIYVDRLIGHFLSEAYKAAEQQQQQQQHLKDANIDYN